MTDPYRVDPDGLVDDLADWQALNWRMACDDPGGDPDDDRKIPRRPDAPDDPSRPAKSNDGSTWGSFDDALENAIGDDTLGLGFPCAQPGHPFVFGDVDIPDGDDGEWVPSYDRLGGVVVERSPSGGSRRVILRGCEIPDWWTNLSDPGKDAREVKLFDETGYVTLTGDTVDGYGLPLESTNQPAFEKWLRDAWYAFNPDAEEGDEPWVERDRGDESDLLGDSGGSNATGGGDDEWLTEADVREALSHIDADVNYDTWRNVGFALSDFFDSRSTAHSVFTDWARGGTKWDNRAPDLADGIIERDESGKRVTIGTVVDLAKRGGWDMSTCPSALEGKRDRSSGDGGDDETGSADSEGGTPTTIDERDDGYYRRGVDSDGNVYYTQLTNFTLEVNSLLTHDDGTREYHLTVNPEPGVGDDPYEVAVEPAVFNEPRTFKAEVVTGFSVWFDGGYSDLNALRSRIVRQDAPRRAGTVRIGIHGDELVTPDGSLTADGWTDDPETIFTGNVECGWSVDPETEVDDDAVATALEYLPQTRQRSLERFLPTLGWFYAAPLSPFIREWEDKFNTLNVLGDTGTGKTATLEVLSELFGFDGDLESANGTPAPKMLHMASSTLPVVFDEYKPSGMSEYRKDQFLEHLRASTRGGFATRGRPDMTVDSYHLKAPVCVSGEQPIQGPAEERRTVLTSFTSDDVKAAPESTEAFTRLVGGAIDGEYTDGVDLSTHAVAYYQWLLGRDRDELRDEWYDATATVERRLSELDLSGLHDLVKQGYATVLFGTRLYRQFASEYGVDAEAVGVSDETTLEAIDYLTREGNGARHVSHVDRLFDVMDRALADGALERGTHYESVDSRDHGPLAVFKMDLTFDKVRKYAREHDVAGVDLLGSYGDYRGRIRDAVGDDDETPIVDTSRNVKHFGRGVAVERSTFDALTDHESDENGRGDDADETADDTAAPPFDALSGGYQTIVGTVSTVADPAPWLAGEGTLVDGNGYPLTYHVKQPKNGSAPPEFDLDEGATYRLERARVTTNGDGEQVVELLPGTTTVGTLREPIGGEQAGLADGGDGDGAQDVRFRAILEELRAATANGEGLKLGELAGRLGHDPTQLASDLERLETRGDVIDHGERWTKND